METIQVKINNEKAIKLLEELENLQLITLIKPKKKPYRLRGKLSDKTAKALHRHVKKLRNEWDRI
jgi:hypothetical protein